MFRPRMKRRVFPGPKGPESKIYTYFQGTGTSLPGLVTPVDMIGGITPTRGSAIGQRIGNRIVITSIYGRAIFRITSPATTNIIRVLIIVDKQNNGTLGLVPANYFANSTGPVWSSVDVNAKSRYRTLYDKTVRLTSGTNTNAVIRWSKKVLIPVQFDDSTVGDYADVISNNLYAYAWSDGNVGQYPTMIWEFNYRFRDV